MATTTPNYNLRKPTNNDQVQVALDIDANMDILDSVVAGKSDIGHAHSGTYVAYVTGLTTGGVTDNTSLIQAAIDAAGTAGGGIVVLPVGTYAHTGLTMKDNVALVGAGRSTILLNTHASNVSISAIGPGSGDYAEGWALKDITLSAATIRSGQHGLSIQLARRFRVERLWVENHDHGIHDSTTWQSTWVDVTCINNNYGWYIATAPVGSGAGNPSGRHGILLKTNNQYGLYIEEHAGVASFFGGGIEGNLVGGAMILGNSTNNVEFSSVNFEDNAGYDAIIGGATTPSQVQFINCYFHRASLVVSSHAIHFVAGSRANTLGCRFDNYDVCLQFETSFGNCGHMMPFTSNCNTWIKVTGRSDLTVTSTVNFSMGDATSAGFRFAGNSLFFAPEADTSIGRSAANLMALGANDAFKTGQDTTANRPTAATVGDGALFYDTTLHAPIWTDGSTWYAPVPTAQLVDVQLWYAAGTQTWTKPTWATTVEVICQAGGGGGGAGRRGAAGTVRCGGGGGAGGALSRNLFQASELASSYTATIGAGGAGAAAQTTNDTDGATGTAGGDSWVGASSGAAIVRAAAGPAGAGGTATTGTGGSAPSGTFGGGSGGTASTTGLVGVAGGSGAGAAGGGSGGGLTTGNAESSGGAGGPSNTRRNTTSPSGGTAGNTGGSATAATNESSGHGAGGGGSSAASTGGTGGAGILGSGGGGGGASVNGQSSGAGGAGADGFVMIVSRR